MSGFFDISFDLSAVCHPKTYNSNTTLNWRVTHHVDTIAYKASCDESCLWIIMTIVWNDRSGFPVEFRDLVERQIPLIGVLLTFDWIELNFHDATIALLYTMSI